MMTNISTTLLCLFPLAGRPILVTHPQCVRSFCIKLTKGFVGKQSVQQPPRTAAKSTSHNNRDHQKLIKIAIIGLPNAGKSTFINNLINHRICPTSSKVHTTRTFSKAIHVKNNSQLILFDTPGLVTDAEVKRHHLESTYMSACRHSIQRADMIGVVHDVSNTWTRSELHSTVIGTLQQYPKVPSFLILNKIDMLKSKRVLLDLTQTLTANTLVPKGTSPKALASAAARRSAAAAAVGSEKINKKESAQIVSWPHFSEIFMISSLNGDGMEGVMKFLLANAKQREWEYDANEFTDQPPEELIVQSVRARLLDFFPQEIPYSLKSEIEYFSQENGQIYASVQITCPSERIERLVCGEKDGKLRQITERVTSDLIETFGLPISLTLATRTIKPNQS